MDEIVRVILAICNEFKLSIKSNEEDKIWLVFGTEELCINDFSKEYQVNILKEYRPEGADYTVIEQV